MEENVPTFVAITGSTLEVAKGFLELSGGDFERAVELYYENPDLASGIGASSSTSAAPPAPPPTHARPNFGRQDSDGVIHIDSDDDDADMQFEDADDAGSDDDRAAVEQAAAMAQEEEDAEMAKRLQEELYGGGGGGGGAGGAGGAADDVRAPIARTTETLVAPSQPWGGDREEVESAILEQLRRRRQGPARSGGPFGQQIWGDASAPPPSTTGNGTHARRLEDLFRPPYDLMERVTWDEARAMGKEDKKWLLVNLQDMSDFNCQALNRDIWKDEAVKALVQESFVFLQYDKESFDAQEYINFYFPSQGQDNPDNYPHVSVVDPRTGEQVKVWAGRPFPSAAEFHAELAEFLDRYSLSANSKNPVAKATVRKPQAMNVDRMTEDEMLEMALKNSLAASGEGSKSASNPNIHDPDALTKSSELGSTTENAAAVNTENTEAEAEAEEASSTAAQRAFAAISSENPHTEPDNDPATTTRIQFRHPTGRVIRRFRLQDPVRRMFEWLKAEPLEGKQGVEFELKKMAGGEDLIEMLDDTVEGMGLKQGTVMIEFIQD